MRLYSLSQGKYGYNPKRPCTINAQGPVVLAPDILCFRGQEASMLAKHRRGARSYRLAPDCLALLERQRAKPPRANALGHGAPPTRGFPEESDRRGGRACRGCRLCPWRIARPRSSLGANIPGTVSACHPSPARRQNHPRQAVRVLRGLECQVPRPDQADTCLGHGAHCIALRVVKMSLALAPDTRRRCFRAWRRRT